MILLFLFVLLFGLLYYRLKNRKHKSDMDKYLDDIDNQIEKIRKNPPHIPPSDGL